MSQLVGWLRFEIWNKCTAAVHSPNNRINTVFVYYLKLHSKFAGWSGQQIWQEPHVELCLKGIKKKLWKSKIWNEFITLHTARAMGTLRQNKHK